MFVDVAVIVSPKDTPKVGLVGSRM